LLPITKATRFSPTAPNGCINISNPNNPQQIAAFIVVVPVVFVATDRW
jgi:hypothetical protein